MQEKKVKRNDWKLSRSKEIKVPIGNQGGVGDKGQKGSQGNIGEKGQKGTIGNPRCPRCQGPVGQKGTIGSQGPVGQKGTIGNQGSVGDVPVGDKGPQPVIKEESEIKAVKRRTRKHW